MTENPLLAPFDVPPFENIRNEHFLPAIQHAISKALDEVDLIALNPQSPSFENTIEALENAGSLLNKVLGVFYPLLSAEADEELMDISLKVSPILSEYNSKISLNESLFHRIDEVYSNSETLNLTVEQRTLLRETYLSFARSGAKLKGKQRDRFREISARLSELTTKFSQNVKKELATYSVALTENQVEGLPPWLLEQMKQNAVDCNSSAPYVLTLQAPEYMAFMKLSPFDDLRHKVYLLYSGRNRSGQFSNIDIIKEIVSLRLEKANLLGYKTFADFKLEQTMAKSPQSALNLLNQLRDAYMPALKNELAELADFAKEKITPWNYAYHSNRLRQARYEFDPETMRPYFELSAVIKGVFGLATVLYGLKFHQRNDVPLYHSDVKCFEVIDSDNSSLGLLYTDFFPRSGRKSPGAWMTDFQEANACQRPQVNIVMNFTKPTAEQPSLLSPGEVTTFLHEFGHALHSLLTKVNYSSLAGTNVYRDFVELPSQFNENFFYSRQFLDSFARHYQSGEPLPNELYERLIASQQFGAAYACIRQLNFAYLDLAFHLVEHPIDDIEQFEVNAISDVQIFPHVDDTLISSSFGHIFAGGYAAGYYSYKWAEVLDADAFAYFEENGIFNSDLSRSFRNNILEKGGTVAPSVLYRNFRGQDANIHALLVRDGIQKF